MSFFYPMLVMIGGALAVLAAMVLIPLVLGAFLQMLPYLIVLGILWYLLR